MKRIRKNNISIDEMIWLQQEAMTKAKAKYDAEVGKLKDLMKKRDESKKNELLSAVEKSSKTYDEIMRFLAE